MAWQLAGLARVSDLRVGDYFKYLDGRSIYKIIDVDMSGAPYGQFGFTAVLRDGRQFTRYVSWSFQIQTIYWV